MDMDTDKQLDAETREQLFFKNIEFFQKFHPNIYFKLNNLSSKQNFTLVSSRYAQDNSTISLTNLQIIASKELAYQSNPLEIANTQALNALQKDSWVNFTDKDNTKQTNIDKIICISNGLGYNLTQYNLRYDIKSMLIIEENLEIFRLSLFVTDYQELCQGKSISFCIEENDDSIRDMVLRFYYSHFFYNDSFKLAQFFNNSKMQYIISVLQENINEAVLNRTVNYNDKIKNTITTNNYEKTYDKLIDDVFKKNIYTKELIFIALELLIFVHKNTSLQTNNNSISNYLYCALYYITAVYKEKGLEHIHTNSFYVIAKSANLLCLQDDIYTKMIYLFNKSKNKELQIFFSEKQIEQLKLKENKTQEEQRNIKHKDYKLLALKGEIVDKSSSEYVTKEFDDFAKSFETVLIDKLKYNTPDELFQLIKPLLTKKNHYKIVDLGCGTGLLGEKLKLISNSLIGVDLSSKMLEQAANKNIYTELVQSDIESFLDTQINNKNYSDIFTATDVFVYIGNLDTTFKGINKSITEDGYFAFSVELLENDTTSFQLNTTGRFSHSLEYINNLANSYDFKIVEQKQTVIRQELNEDVIGAIFVLQKHNKEV